VFFAPTRGSVVLALGGAASTAVLFGGLKTVVGVCGAPVLTLPFCAAMTACFVLEGKAAGLRLR
jgi:urea transporter